MNRKQRSRPARFGIAFDAEQRFVRERWLYSLGFPCMVSSGLHIEAKLSPYSQALALIWLIMATIAAGITLYSAVRGWVIWWRRRSQRAA